MTGFEKRGFVRRSTRHPDGQREMLLSKGVQVIYSHDAGEPLEAAIRALRTGDELHVTTLDRLAGNRRELRRLIDAIHDRGAVIVEARTGRSTKNKRDIAGDWRRSGRRHHYADDSGGGHCDRALRRVEV